MTLQQNDVETVNSCTKDDNVTTDEKEGKTNSNKPIDGKGKPPAMTNRDVLKSSALADHSTLPDDHVDGCTEKKKKKKKKKNKKTTPPTSSLISTDHGDGCVGDHGDRCTGDRGDRLTGDHVDGLTGDHGDGLTGEHEDGYIGVVDGSSVCKMDKQGPTGIRESVTSPGQCIEHSLARTLTDGGLDSLNGSNCIEKSINVEINSVSSHSPVAPPNVSLSQPNVSLSQPNVCLSQPNVGLSQPVVNCPVSPPMEQGTKESCKSLASESTCAPNGNGTAGAAAKRKASRKQAQNKNPNSDMDLVQPQVRNKNDTTAEQQQQGNSKDSESEKNSCKKPRINKKKPQNKKKREKKKCKETCEEKLQGLVNSGNSCYMNAALQLLCSVDTFREFKLEPDLEGKKSNHFVCQFTQLMRQMREKRTSPLDASDIKKEVGETIHRFSDNSEQDSQEFLTVLLEKIHNTLMKTRCSPPATSSQDKDSSCDKCEIEVQAEESWHRHLEQGHSVVVEWFQGQLVSTLECDACKHVLTKFDPFMFLPIPVPSRPSNMNLEECLRLYTNEEIIEGWPCSACHETVKVKRKVQLWKAPPFLMLYLKRYKLDKTGERRKVCTLVKFPLSGLDLSSSHMQTPKGEEASYNLCAVINHDEDGHNSGGHYTTVSRCGEQWLCFDDNTVYPCVEKDIVTPSAYVLLYKRNDTHCRSESEVTEVPGRKPESTGPLAKLPLGMQFEAGEGSCVSMATLLPRLSECKSKITELSVSCVDKNEMAEKLRHEVDEMIKEMEANARTRANF